ncbi:MAG TPA: L-histidine N(alpha)-methyltransferase [Flavobacterium sp.]|jgi:dimethylhistidine N-methyltransferase
MTINAASNEEIIAGRKFREEILAGLKNSPKSLPSKYFYDKNGDVLFQQIMACPEYYLTKCELEIFREKSSELVRAMQGVEIFDIIELGAGDATKSFYLLNELTEQEAQFHYYPIDISYNILEILKEDLKQKLPTLEVTALHGEYLEMLSKVSNNSKHRKVILFLGSNIGNMTVDEARGFCKEVRSQLQPGDMFLIGFDLKKNPEVILKAYTDREGLTSQFNLNLLYRINSELGANFAINQFRHYQNYDPETGACKSYLVSLCAQNVTVATEDIGFKKDEVIYWRYLRSIASKTLQSLRASRVFQQDYLISTARAGLLTAFG